MADTSFTNYLSSKTYVTDLPVSAMVCRLDFLCFVSVPYCAFSKLTG